MAAALCLVAFAGRLPIQCVQADEAQSLDQFLARLGLTDLRLTNLQRLLDREVAAKQQQVLARQLADLYAEELIAAADEPERFASLYERFEKLLAKYPTANSPTIEVVRLQAEYQRAESLLLHWLEEPADKESLATAKQILTQIQPQLEVRQTELTAAIEAAEEAIDNIKSDQERQLAEQKLLRDRAAAARADFFAGWAAYYLGIARQKPTAARSDFTTAKQHFTRLLDVTDDKDYAAIEPETIGLESIWRSRAVCGLGLTELGLKHQAAAERVFGWLSHASVPPVLRDQAAYWQLRGLLNVGSLTAAAHFAASETAAFSSAPSPGKSSLAIAALRAGAAAAGNDREQLVAAGIRGLARMRQFDTLDKLIEQYHLDAGVNGDDFHLTWLRGRREYLAAEKAKSAEGFRAAAETLTAALTKPAARTELTEAGQARYYLGWSRYRLDEFDAAARLFQEAAATLHTAVPEIALQAAWMRCSCLVQLVAKDKRHVPAASAALSAFKQEYPASEEAQQADILLTRLLQSHAEPQVAIRQLAAIKPGEPSYAAAQFEICQLQFQLWNKGKSDAAKAEPIAADLLKSVDRYLSLPSKNTEPERRIKAVLLAVDVLQSEAKPERGHIASLMSSVSQAVEAVSPSSLPAVEYQYRRLQLAQSTGDAAAASSAADWIATHGTGTPYELPALVVQARAADQAVSAASGPERTKHVRTAAGLYERLVKLLGDSPATLGSNKNALAAASKLAQYDEALERWPAAADRLGRLVAAQPRDRRLLRRAGIASFLADRPTEALEYWRTLLTGLDNGSDGWLEAKYFQLLCLEKTDWPTCQKVYQQFQVLYPEVKSAAWREKFAELNARMK